MKAYAILNLSNIFTALDELASLHGLDKMDYEYLSGVAIYDGDPSVAKKASFITTSGVFLGKSNDLNEIKEIVKGKCFSIKLNSIYGKDKDLLIEAYEKVKDVIKLSKACETLDMISTDGQIVLGLRKAEHDTKSILKHSEKPFRQSGTMDSRTSRLLVNLARPKRIVLDPFVGTGSILIEARWLGYECIGGDLDRRMLQKAQSNLRYFGYDCMLINSSAFNIPLRGIDSIATDPPYGRSCTTFGAELKDLYYNFFISAVEVLKNNSYLVFATSSDLDFRDMLKSVGFKNMRIHFIYLHKSLSRAIYVVYKS
ncbi:MAG: TRM11 family methyltransferase [Sulfolobaceae archaeon]|nr:TRM11 family methyltransferase [Sulfolobaceae archaeon]